VQPSVWQVDDAALFTFTRGGTDHTSALTLAEVTASRVYTLTAALATDGTDDQAYVLSLSSDAANGIEDAATNINEASNSISWTYDCSPPTLALTSGEADETNVYPIDVTLTFSELALTLTLTLALTQVSCNVCSPPPHTMCGPSNPKSGP